MKTLVLVLLSLLTAILVQAADPKATNLTPDEAERLLKEKPGIVILDVRTPEEFSAGHIPGAVNLDFHGDKFNEQLAGLDKSKEYLVHCAAGGRSAKTCKVLDEKAFPKVYHLPGGFTAWEKAGKAVEK